MNGQANRGQIPNGYPPGRQNGQAYGAYGSTPQDGPGRGVNNNNHKSQYGESNLYFHQGLLSI